MSDTEQDETTTEEAPGTGPQTIPDAPAETTPAGDPMPETGPIVYPPDEGENAPAQGDEPDESEQGDEPDAAPEPATDEPVAVAMSEKAMEKAFRDFERLRKDVAGRVGRIMGDDAAHLMECPLCAELAPGWLWPPEVAPLPEATKARVLVALGFAAPADYKQHPSVHTCPTCDGLGSVLSGSKVDAYKVIECPDCQTKGWVGAHVPTPLANGASNFPETLTLTGPTVYGDPPPAESYDDDPAVSSLKARGFLVVPPPNYSHA